MFSKKEFHNLVSSVMQVEYLILCLMLLYISVPGTNVDNKYFVVLAGMFYTVLLIVFHFVFHNKMNTLELSIKAIITVVFISFMVWHTGKMNSPLLILYLFGIISSAMVLGKSTTLLLVGLVTASMMFFTWSEYGLAIFSLESMNAIMELVISIFAMFLVAYLTFMLAAHMQHAKEEIKNSSELDELTGLFNYRTFNNIVNNEEERFMQYSGNYSLLMIDVDNIKSINDQYGYSIGDRLMVLISNIIKRATRPTDIVARYREDEFIVLLSETARDNALKVAERMRSQVDVTPLILEGGKEVFSSISVGMACFPGDSNDFDELLKRAAMAMYESKDHGKNRITNYASLFANNHEHREEA